MISRREVVTAGVLGTLATGAPAAAAEMQAEVQALKEGLSRIDSSIDSVRSTLDTALRGNSMNFGHVGTVKNTISRWAKTSGRFPEYLEIGIDVFYDVYDWHVRNNQQIQVSRISEQRLAILFMFTQLVLRWENDGNYVGVPY